MTAFVLFGGNLLSCNDHGFLREANNDPAAQSRVAAISFCASSHLIWRRGTSPTTTTTSNICSSAHVRPSPSIDWMRCVWPWAQGDGDAAEEVRWMSEESVLQQRVPEEGLAFSSVRSPVGLETNELCKLTAYVAALESCASP